VMAGAEFLSPLNLLRQGIRAGTRAAVTGPLVAVAAATTVAEAVASIPPPGHRRTPGRLRGPPPARP